MIAEIIFAYQTSEYQVIFNNLCHIINIILVETQIVLTSRYMQKTRFPHKGYQLKKIYNRLISNVTPNVVPTQRDALGRPSNYGLNALYLDRLHPEHYKSEGELQQTETYPGRHQM